MSYYNRIPPLNGLMRVKDITYARKSIRFYREVKDTVIEKREVVIIGNARLNPKIIMQSSKRADQTAEGKVRFDKILNSMVSNFIFKNFPWDKKVLARDKWTAVGEVEMNVPLTGFESYNSWYKVYRTAAVNRSRFDGGSGFWATAINKLLGGKYSSPNVNPVNIATDLSELLRKIEQHYKVFEVGAFPNQ